VRDVFGVEYMCVFDFDFAGVSEDIRDTAFALARELGVCACVCVCVCVCGFVDVGEEAMV